MFWLVASVGAFCHQWLLEAWELGAVLFIFTSFGVLNGFEFSKNPCGWAVRKKKLQKQNIQISIWK